MDGYEELSLEELDAKHKKRMEELDAYCKAQMDKIKADALNHKHKMDLHRITLDSELRIAKNKRDMDRWDDTSFMVGLVAFFMFVFIAFIAISAALGG